MAFKLRDYQAECLESLFGSWTTNQSVLGVLATGLGKTEIFTQAANRFHERVHDRSADRVLVVCPQLNLIRQAAEKITKRTGIAPDIEQAENWANDTVWGKNEFVVGSVQTLCRKRKDGTRRFERFTDIGLLVIDEADKFITKDCLELINFFKARGTKILGVTATPKRHDKKAMGLVFDDCPFNMGIVEAVKLGWLCSAQHRCVKIESLDLTGVRSSGSGEDKDFVESELAARLEGETTVFEIAHVAAKESAGLKTVVYCASVEQARHVAERLRLHYKLRADWICADQKRCTKERQDEVLDSFTKDEDGIQIVCNVGILTTGWDFPGLECIIMARVTKSKPLYCLDEKTEVLTDQGWIGIDDDPSGKQIAAFDMKTGAIEWSPCLGKVCRELEDDEEMYALQNPHIDFRVSGDHNIVIQKTQKRTRDLSERLLVKAKDVKHIRDKMRLPSSGLQESPGVPLTDAEIRFIGWVLTDGHINKITNAISITQSKHQPWNKDIEDCLTGCGFRYTKKELSLDRGTKFKQTSPLNLYTVSKGMPRKRGTPGTGWAKLEPYLVKDFSPLLENLNRRQLAILLHAMHLGDGSKQDGKGQTWVRRSYHICIPKKEVADKLQSLCVRRGFMCNVTKDDSPARLKPIYLAHIKDQDYRHLSPCGYPRPTLQPSPKTPGERVWCLQANLGTLVTRRNGKSIILGNCQIYGRGTRTLPGVVDFDGSTAESRRSAIAASDKPHFKMVDITDANMDNKIVTAIDVLGGEYNSEVIERAKRKSRAKESASGGDIQQDLTDAEKELQEEEEERKRLERARIGANIQYSTTEVDSFNPYSGSRVVREVVKSKLRVMFGRHKGKSISDVPLHDLKFYGTLLKNKPSMQKAIANEVERRSNPRSVARPQSSPPTNLAAINAMLARAARGE